MSEALTRAHIEAERRLRVAVTQLVERAWRGLPGHDEANVDQFVSRVVPVILGGQRQSVAVTEAYLALKLGRDAAIGVDPDTLIGAAVRNGTPPEEVYKRPFVTLWSALGDGTQFAEAYNAALARATTSAAADLQLSMRATAGAVQAADEKIFGYQRVADGEACSFCSEVDGAYLKDGDAMPLHPNCGCSVDPLTAAHPRAVHLPDGTRIRSFQGGPLINTPPPAGVAISEHGELGPMLHDPAHDFTSHGDI